ncbi:MAG: ABC transporter substrate-binding protein [Acidimicrobiales bacterium]
MKSLRRFRTVGGSLVLASSITALSALGPMGAGPAGAAAKLPSCPISALAKAKGTVDITFWNSMTRANATTLSAITNAFNSSQTKVHVTLVDQASYDDTWQKYEAGLTNGQLPDVVQLEDERTQQAVDTESILPVQSCIKATHYSTSDFLQRPLDYWKVDGVQQAMPFAVSNPIFIYNKAAFTKAGLNPNDPPLTLSAMTADAKALKASGSGMGLVLDDWHLETWLATANTLFVNNHNGRSARATKGVFDGPEAKAIFTDLDAMVKSGDAVTNPATGPDQYDNLLGIGTGKYGMTIDSSADLGTITQVLDSGAYPNVQLGVGPFPVLSSKIQGGIEPGGSGLYISNKVPAVDQAAAWQFITYLDNTQSQATWAAGTGYIPLRVSSTQTATVQHLWATDPGYKVAYEQQLNGKNDPATAGSVIGPYDDVRTDILTAEENMFQTDTSPSAALANAQKAVDATISQYNQRLG